MDRDHNTPEWVQHIAFEVDDYDALLAAKNRVEGEGLEVIGPTNHGIFQSIYFFDPNGHRLELSAWHRRCLKNGAGPRKLRATQPGCTNSNSQARNR
jgi:catechol-2,3-dioxygenase